MRGSHIGAALLTMAVSFTALSACGGAEESPSSGAEVTTDVQEPDAAYPAAYTDILEDYYVTISASNKAIWCTSDSAVGGGLEMRRHLSAEGIADVNDDLDGWRSATEDFWQAKCG